MLRGLFLDDERNPSDVTWENYPSDVDWTIVRSYQEFLQHACACNWDVVSFDHDIQSYEGNRERTGYDCLKYFLDTDAYHNCREGMMLFFHSKNPVGKKNMLQYWASYDKFMSEQGEQNA